jgi:hypothetical protein
MCESKTNGIIRKYSSRAFQRMVMSVCFDNPKYFGAFLFSALGDRSHRQCFSGMIEAQQIKVKKVTRLLVLNRGHNFGLGNSCHNIAMLLKCPWR